MSDIRDIELHELSLELLEKGESVEVWTGGAEYVRLHPSDPGETEVSEE